MKTIILLGCAAALAVLGNAASAAAKHPVSSLGGHYAHRVVAGAPRMVVLWDQGTGDAGAAISSQNFGPDLDMFDDQAADDFVVPPGRIWKIKRVDVTGQYTGGVADSEHVTIYGDVMGLPGPVLADCDGLAGIDNGGSFSIKIKKPCRIMLGEGRYWLSVVANQGVAQWLWETRLPIVGLDAVWQNPKGGWGMCPTWGSLGACFGIPDDLMFVLRGKDKMKQPAR